MHDYTTHRSQGSGACSELTTTPFQFYHKALPEELWKSLQTEAESRATLSSQRFLCGSELVFHGRDLGSGYGLESRAFSRRTLLLCLLLSFWDTVTSMCICTDITGSIAP